ncbi:hypothetical protein ACFOU2_17515 [Bacillus songklensis]|uniref:Uncharacterized protein n=2 Tax=Bacillus songklensis TaxID=1069116 RepID=A0ABV8B4B3_9BACI
MIRLSLFVVGILFQSVAALDFMFELNLLPIQTRKMEHYAEVFTVRMPFILFAIGFAFIILSFYFPVFSRRRDRFLK